VTQQRVSTGGAYESRGRFLIRVTVAPQKRADAPAPWVTAELWAAHTAGGKLLPQPGGVLIRGADGTILGAAGASGGAAPEDEAVCVHGITVVGFQAEA